MNDHFYQDNTQVIENLNEKEFTGKKKFYIDDSGNCYIYFSKNKFDKQWVLYDSSIQRWYKFDKEFKEISSIIKEDSRFYVVS